MSTLPLSANEAPQIWSVPGLSRIAAYLSFVADIFGEAQQTMREANKKYPYAGI